MQSSPAEDVVETIAKYMSRNPITIDCAAVLDDAAELMRERRVHHLVVTDHGRVVGTLSDRDLYRFKCAKPVSPAIVAIAEAMSPEPLQVSPDRSLGDVAARMADADADVAIVMKDDRPVGIFTTSDALRLLAGRPPRKPSA
jgi:CBS domain-containing protein